MQTMREIFSKPIDRPIEGVIKANDESSLRTEVEEYVLTHEVSQRLETFISAYNDYNAATQNGVWISGFFGSGKSHLLKMLALLLENREIDGQRIADMFLPKCEDQIFRASLQKACSRPSKSILFNIDQKTDTINTRQTDALLSVFVKVFDEMCGYYGKQGYIAKFERDLDKRSLYQRFQESYERIAGKAWTKGREQAILESRNIARTYADITGEPEENANGIIDKYRRDYKLSIEDFAAEVKEYIDRQAPGFRLNFFVDEVGQYIADNVKLMLNLQSIAEALATVCKGQAWIIVTAQEDMTSVLGEFNKKQGNDFSKIQARFANRLKLTSANVDEVIKKRLLEKKADCRTALESIYEEQKNNFKTIFGFIGGTKYKQYSGVEDFISCYPFVPYQFTLFQEAIKGLSDHNVFEGRHNSVGERSMLGVFQMVAVALGDREVGSLASFDLMFEGIRQSVKSTAVQAIRRAEQHLDDEDAIRVLKVLFLVKYYSRQFIANARNISVLLQRSFSENAEARLKRIQEALNRLDSESYVQRNGDVYEYLTDEEQDIEKEIKNTWIDSTDVADYLNRVLFEGIIGGTKIRYVGNAQDYTLGKRLDCHNVGIERELAMHIITPWYERNTGGDIYTASWDKGELLVVMPQDDRFMSDVTMFLKTAKYVKQNISTASESVRKILDAKQAHAHDREADIEAKAKNLLAESELSINGNKLAPGSSDARQRILAADQELIAFFYTNLKMLGSTKYQMQSIPTYFAPGARDFFPSELSEAETEVLNAVKANQSAGLRTTIKGLCDKLTKRPYGWYNDAIICLVAQLAARGRLNVRSDGNLLEDEKLIAALKNPHNYDNMTLEPQADYSAAQVKKVKDFFSNYFGEPADSSDPKALGKQLQSRLQEFLDKLKAYDGANRRGYGFWGELTEPLSRLQKVAAKPAEYFFVNCPQSELSQLCDDKEDYFDPVVEFMTKSGHTIMEEAMKLLKDQQANIDYITARDELSEINDIVRDPRCFRGVRMPRLKELTAQLSGRISAAVAEEQKCAAEKIDEMRRHFVSLPDFAAVSQEDQQRLTAGFDRIAASLKQQNLIAVIREQLHTFEDTTGKRLAEELYTLAHPSKAAAAAKGGAAKVEAVQMPEWRVKFDKPWLEDDADIDAYFARVEEELRQLKEKLREEVKNGKRIRL